MIERPREPFPPPAVPPPHRLRLPHGLAPVGLGVAVLGATSYAFLVITARTLGPERYAPLSATWALVFLIGPGFFLPVEQELARALSGRRAQGVDGRSVVRKVALASGVVVSLLLVAVAAGAPLMLGRLFDDELLLLLGLVVSIPGFMMQHLVRGVVGGSGRFGLYGAVLVAEGAFRLGGAVLMALAGVSAAGPYGLALGASPLLGCVVALRRRRDDLRPGPGATWGEVSEALSWLLAGSLLVQVLINSGPLVVKLLASESEQAAASRFLAGLILARVPLFLFQAVQASLLPRFSWLATAGHGDRFRRTLRVLVTGIAVLGVASTVGAALVGPQMMRVVFGPGFVLPGGDLAYLAGGTAAFILAIALGQAVIALSGHARAALSWLLGVGGFSVAVLLGSDLLRRVETALLTGSVVAAAGMALQLRAVLVANAERGVGDRAPAVGR